MSEKKHLNRSVQTKLFNKRYNIITTRKQIHLIKIVRSENSIYNISCAKTSNTPSQGFFFF